MKTKATVTSLFLLLASSAAWAQGRPEASTADATAQPAPSTASADATAPSPSAAPAEGQGARGSKPEARPRQSARATAPRPVSDASPRPTARVPARPGARPAGPRPAGKPTCPAGCVPVVVKKAGPAKPKKKKKEGWQLGAKASAVTSLLYNKNIPGVDDGLTFSLGAVLSGHIGYVRGPHVWDAKLKITETVAKTPTVSPILKTADEMVLSTTYRYSLPRFHRLRVFGSAEMTAPLFPGDLVPSEDTELTIHRTDGTVETDTAKADERYDLTDGFSPLIFRQLVGGWITPIEETTGVLDVKLSLAGEEVVASGFAVQDDAATAGLDLVELQSYTQMGFRLDIGMKGTLKKRLKYELAAVFMFPVYTSVDTDLTGFDLMNADLSFKLGVTLAKWASVDYQFSAKRMPMIVRQWQVVSNLVLTLTANIL